MAGVVAMLIQELHDQLPQRDAVSQRLAVAHRQRRQRLIAQGDLQASPRDACSRDQQRPTPVRSGRKAMPPRVQTARASDTGFHTGLMRLRLTWQQMGDRTYGV